MAEFETSELPRKIVGSKYIDPMAVPTLFLNTGWMIGYKGQQPGDEIQGGEAYVREKGFGHEVFNFQEFNGRYYGYAHSDGLDIKRIGPSPHRDRIENGGAITKLNNSTAGPLI